MSIENRVVSRCVARGEVVVGGARYFAAGLEMHAGAAVDIVVRGDGSACAEIGGRRVELSRID